MDIIIREERHDDIESIHEITRSAFFDKATSSNTEHYIVDALRDSGALCISLVAERDGQVIGHVAISPITVSDGSLDWFGLGPISVLPEHQLQGIGSLLMQDVLASLKQRGAAGCVLLGSPDYYARFGFAVRDGLILADVPAKYFQVLAFNGKYATGRVEYHSGFSATA